MRVWRTSWMAWCGLAVVVAVATVAGMLAFPGRRPKSAQAFPIRLRDVTADTGITFQHTDGGSGKRYIIESMSAGVATFDYDGDGLLDIYFINGCPLPGTPVADPPPTNRLYRNRGGGQFEDVTDQAGVGETGYGLGVCIADYNHDGFPDIYVSNFGPKVLYRNNGDGTFTDVTQQAGVADGDQVGAGSCFLDMDGDGNLDLYVANYVDFTCAKHLPEFSDGFPVYTSPKAYNACRHSIYQNLGDGSFADVTQESGIGARVGPGMGVVCMDYDNDGHTDIFTCNDGYGNFCWHNDGDGHFEEVALTNGLKFNGDGAPVASMGADVADYDHDGWFDIFQTSYQGERPILFKNLGGVFEDVTRLTDAAAGGLNNVKWGCGFADFDNDSHVDIFYLTGHIQDNVELFDRTTSYEGYPVLLKNSGEGDFVNVSDLCGNGLQVKMVGRGLALDDLDNDGCIDVVILNSRRPAVVLQGESATDNHWLEIQLRGVKANRDGVGARVKVTAGNAVVQFDEVHSGRGYQSHFGSRLHFGLGQHERVDQVEVQWPGGGVDVLKDVPVDDVLTIIEGQTVPIGKHGRTGSQRDNVPAVSPLQTDGQAAVDR
ncbi:MAG: CRTAC1 family protein [Pirellulaceae bacterium]